MICVKQLQFDTQQLDQFIQALRIYWITSTKLSNGDRAEIYAHWMVKKFYEQLLKRQIMMLVNGRKKITVRFDAIHAILMVDVLRKVDANITTNTIIAELGTVIPPQLMR